MGFSIALSSRTLLKNAVLVYGLATAFISAGPCPGWADAAPQTAEVARAYLEDELPAYTEVVQGASIARSMPYSEGSPARGRVASPSRRDGSPKDNYRPDVQLQ